MGLLRIDICNERLLPRFGVDRLLVLLGRHLAAAGHDVRFISLRCDRSMLTGISADVQVLDGLNGLNISGTEAAACSAVFDRWQQRRPNVIVSGGWPFYTAAARAGEHGVHSLYIDAGAVAQDGLAEPMLEMQQELRRIRQLTLPTIASVLPISDFIRTSQTIPDRGHSTGVRTVHLGADHMALGMFRSDPGAPHGAALLSRLDGLITQGQQLILGLSRYETQGYKNSHVLYDVLRSLLRTNPNVRLLLLDGGVDCNIPRDLSTAVEALGSPDDPTLQEVMRRCILGISPSLWEGFNLPIAEMQWLGRPALAMNRAANPEVIVDPWLLCSGIDEIIAKTTAVLNLSAPVDFTTKFERFRTDFVWAKTLAAWQDEIQQLTTGPYTTTPAAPSHPRSRRIVLIDVSNASRDTANPGIIRVTRRLSAELQRQGRLELVFANWDLALQTYVFLDPARQALLESYGGPTDGLSLLASNNPEVSVDQLITLISPGRPQPPVLFFPEVLPDEPQLRLKWAQSRGYRTAAILHDLIPINHPTFCDPSIVARFTDYVRALCKMDAVFSNSDSSLNDLKQYATENRLTLPHNAETLWLPGQLGTTARSKGQNETTDEGEIRILCVSTIEPRKNHRRLIAAFRAVRARNPRLRMRLILIGNRYAGTPELSAEIEAVTAQDPSIEWHGSVTDAHLEAEFEKSTFTVYPSLFEGFGLPILESLWMARPCVTHNCGVMQELAARGGCVTVDMTDEAALAATLEHLATDAALRAQLACEMEAREISTWQDYADIIGKQLATV